MFAMVPLLSAPQPDGPQTIPATTTPDIPSPAEQPPAAKSPSKSSTTTTAQSPVGPPLTAADSVLGGGSWSTLSIPKSSNGTTPAVPTKAGSSSRKSKATSSSSKNNANANDGSVVATPTTGTFLAPKSRSKSRRPPTLSTPTAPRTLVPEPAPPPPSALSNKALRPPQRLSSSSKDRRTPRKHGSSERRQSTPYPLSVVTRRNRVSSGPLSGVPMYPSETGGSERPAAIPVRRPSPVPPSSSHSDSDRSSDSYVSLKEGGSKPKPTTSGPPPAIPLPSRPLPQAPPISQILPSMTSKPSGSQLHLLATLRSQAQSPLRIPPATPAIRGAGVFHPSPLNPNPIPPSPYNPFLVPSIARLSPLLGRQPGRHAHIVPLPSLTYPSAQQRPRPLPASEVDGQVWTSTMTGMEEYASDHPVDLVQRAIEMEARDELERVRVWCIDVSRTFVSPADGARVAGEDEPAAGGDEFFLLEKPPAMDLAALMPHRVKRRRRSRGGEEVVEVLDGEMMVPVLVSYATEEERAVKDRQLPRVPTVAVAAPTPDSLVPFPRLNGGVALDSNGRMASPYPAPPDGHIVHLGSSSASSRMGGLESVPQVVLPVAEQDEKHLTTQKSFVSLTTPSPFAGLPSPLRLPLMQTPMTPFYPLGSVSKTGEEVLTPPAQEPLPPILEPRKDAQEEQLEPRVPSALERVSSYLGSTTSLRPPSPETPPRIIHSSNSCREGEDAPGQDPLAAHTIVPSRTRTRSRSSSDDDSESIGWKRVRSADDSGSTVSRAFTRTSRGRSPTRRSWKAASERAATSHHNTRVGGGAGGILPLSTGARFGVGMVVQRIDGTEKVTVVQPVLVSRALESTYSWPDKLSSVGDERPRTASRSSGSRYSMHEDSVPPKEEGRPETGMSVLTADLFYKAAEELPKSTSPETVKEVKKDLEVVTMLAAPQMVNRPSGVSPSVLRRRKSHRARQSVVSPLPAEEEEEEDHPSGKVKMERPPVSIKVQVPPFAEVLPAALRTSFPSTTSAPFVSPATSKAIQPLLPLVRPSFHSSHSPVTSPRVSNGSGSATPVVHSLLFNKLVVLIAQFNSDLSLGRNKVPRWKRDCAEMEEKVRSCYEAFAGAVERSRVEFRPWVRGERRVVEDEEESEGGRRVMHVDDLWEKIEDVSARGNLSAQAVQDDIIRSVTSSWEFLASQCLESVREVLSQLVTSIVDLHFRCAGDGNQLRMIVQSVANAQLQTQVEMTGRKLGEFAALEARNVFSSSPARLKGNAAAILSHFKDLRRQTEHTMLDQGPLRQSPIPIKSASISKPLEAGPASHSRESHSMSVPSSFTGQTSSLFSKGGVPLSTVATSEDQGRQSEVAGGLRRRLVEQQRQKTDEALQMALLSLRSFGFHDLASPEQLLEKLVEPDPVDGVLDIMANVVAYLDFASIRFVDYITLHIEDYLVNAIGEKINAAVVADLDLSGPNIEERCFRWMTA